MNARRFACCLVASLCVLASGGALAQGLPPGDYPMTCTGIHVGSDNVLRAKCKNLQGAMVDASVQLPCKTMVLNINGTLGCVTPTKPTDELTIINKSVTAVGFWVGPPNSSTRYVEDCIEAGQTKVLKLPAEARYVGNGYAYQGCSGAYGSNMLTVSVGSISVNMKNGKGTATVWSALSVHDDTK